MRITHSNGDLIMECLVIRINMLFGIRIILQLFYTICFKFSEDSKLRVFNKLANEVARIENKFEIKSDQFSHVYLYHH